LETRHRPPVGADGLCATAQKRSLGPPNIAPLGDRWLNPVTLNDQ
jgi:hypothetical protein